MNERARMKHCIEALKQRWEAEGFVRKGPNGLVRPRQDGVDGVVFVPPGSWRMKIQVTLLSWDARLASLLAGQPVSWNRSTGYHFGQGVQDWMGEGVHYIGEEDAAAAGFGSDGLTDFIWSFAPRCAQWFHQHADSSWLAEHRAEEARALVDLSRSRGAGALTLSWNRAFTQAAFYGRLAGREALLPEMRQLHEEAIALCKAHPSERWSAQSVLALERRGQDMFTHLAACVREGAMLVPPPGGTGIELGGWRWPRYVESLKASLETKGFVRKGAHKLVRVTEHGLDVVELAEAADCPGLRFTLGVWRAALAAARGKTELDWPRKRFRFPTPHHTVAVAALMGLNGELLEEDHKDAAGFEGELDSYIWSFSDRFDAWFEERADPSWWAAELEREAQAPDWQEDLDRYIGPRLSASAQRKLDARLQAVEDKWPICAAVLVASVDLKSKSLERADELLHALLPQVDDLSGLGDALRALLARKPGTKVNKTIGRSLSSVIGRPEYLHFAATLFRQKRAPSSGVQTFIREALEDWRIEDEGPKPQLTGLLIQMLQRTRKGGSGAHRRFLHGMLAEWDPVRWRDASLWQIQALELFSPPKKDSGSGSWESSCLRRLTPDQRSCFHALVAAATQDSSGPELAPVVRADWEAWETRFIEDWLEGLELT